MSEYKKASLEHFGFHRPWYTIVLPWLLLIFFAAAAAAIGWWVASKNLPHLSGAHVALAVLSLGALVLGYQQWRSARQEITLDKFYDRLDRANKRIERSPGIRKLMAPQWERSSDADFESCMYTFMELDNLEYSMEKYKLGFMTKDNAYRALLLFRSRLRSPDFRRYVVRCVRDFGYQDATHLTVDSLLRDYPAESPNGTTANGAVPAATVPPHANGDKASAT